ncbi:hypothetical protein JYU34_010345 [Plutella xylostella]|uniref:Transmembrane protein 53 n=2 Tax=Plutella xylostella TaxID=51655 RepID=A0ABQ7QI76_PLUXY|nr:uncharacterized protein LOC105398188 isoform X1 [Plutella xylostella]XP_048481438.1 uncharacterized protein LOC105398188 isoform X2 [Plutella xylostella]XP_048481439.1 uncharacterized protein LOC105398188 isoform X2 [Plutella xylostella]KAG7304931.1 hypothetical protein JYU34_010345 [Plutella xylostella]
MNSVRTFVSFALSNGKHGIKTSKNTQLRQLLSCAPLGVAVSGRGAHSQDLTKNIQYISNDKVKLTVDPVTMRLDKQIDRPLCIMMNWLLAQHKHVMKYAALYLEQGFDVVSASCSPWQLMWPMKGSQLIAGDLLKLIANNPSYSPLTLHGFSVAGYLWGEVCMHANANKPLYQPVLDRVVAQVWDSAADISEITIGVPAAVFPRNAIMQRTLRTYMEYHMKTFHESATVHYMRSSQTFHLNPCHAPALFLLSKTDPVGSETSNRRVYESWVRNGIQCTWKVFDKSPHVQHFIKHPKEYVSALYTHLDAANVLTQPEKMRMRC